MGLLGLLAADILVRGYSVCVALHAVTWRPAAIIMFPKNCSSLLQVVLLQKHLARALHSSQLTMVSWLERMVFYAR